MKTTPIRNCQSCGKPFAHGDIVYFVPLDNNIVCLDCAIPHLRTEERIFEINADHDPIKHPVKYLSRDERIESLMGLLQEHNIKISGDDLVFLEWLCGSGFESYKSLRGLLEKCLGVEK